jgi:hypothetical protein
VFRTERLPEQLRLSVVDHLISAHMDAAVEGQPAGRVQQGHKDHNHLLFGSREKAV